MRLEHFLWGFFARHWRLNQLAFHIAVLNLSTSNYLEGEKLRYMVMISAFLLNTMKGHAAMS
jgi:hypothetical protein